MRSKTSTDAAEMRRKAGVETPVTATPMHVVECDAWELTEFYDRSDSLIPDCNRDVFNSITHCGNAEWRGGINSWEAARSVLRDGWPEGSERARNLAANLLPLLPPPESLRRRTKWGEDGGELDRDRLYASGIETAFRTTKQHLQRAPRVVRIIASWSISGWHSAEQIAWNGAAITALVDLLEASDYRVELSIALPANQGSSISLPVVRVKIPQEPLNIDTVASVAGHAGIFRTYGFAAITSSTYKVRASFGSPMQLKPVWKQGEEAGVLELPDAYMKVSYDEDGAFKSVSEVLKQLLPDDQELAERLKQAKTERDTAKRGARV